MRFVRYWTRKDTGEVVAVAEHEGPLDGVTWQCEWDLEVHDLGLVNHFEPTELDGTRCLPSRHLHLRLDHHPTHGAQAKPGHVLPTIHDCPPTIEGIRARLREKGHKGIPTIAHAWLWLVLRDDTYRSLGLGAGVTTTHLKLLDGIRRRRDPSLGVPHVRLEQAVQRKSDVLAAAHLARRQAKKG